MLQKDRFKLRYFVAAATDVTSLQKAETLGVPLLMRCCKRIVLHPYILLLLPLLLRVFRMLKYLRVPLLMRDAGKRLFHAFILLLLSQMLGVFKWLNQLGVPLLMC